MIEDTLTQVKLLKEKAKANRDFGDLQKALSRLNRCIELLENADRGEGEDSDKEKIHKELADCYGMKGGIYRRLADKEDPIVNYREAAEWYSKGLEFEDKANDSYNFSNSIVMQILTDPANLKKLQSKILDGIDLIWQQIRNKRKGQWWAWADLGLFYLLNGEEESAIDAYKQFGRVGARLEDYDSTVLVLNSLLSRLRQVNSPDTDSAVQSLEHAIDFLKQDAPGRLNSLEKASALKKNDLSTAF